MNRIIITEEFMEIFLDTGSFSEIEKAVKFGFIDGVTTNPALLSKSAGDLNYRQCIEKVVDIVGPEKKVFAEVLALDSDTMYKEGVEVASWGPNMVIKVPAVMDGVLAISRLSKEGISCAMTLVYTTAQGVMAAKAGAKYAATFVARSYEVGMNGIEITRDLAEIYRIQGLECKVLAASLRNPADSVKAIKAGARSVTLPFACLNAMTNSPCSIATLNDFLELWTALNKGGIL